MAVYEKCNTTITGGEFLATLAGDYEGIHLKKCSILGGITREGNEQNNGGLFPISMWIKIENCTFTGFVSFNSTEFKERVEIEACFFPRGVSFDNSRFNKRAIFSGSRFYKSANFNSSQFGELALFSSAHFEGYAMFNNAEFSRRVFFRCAEFEEGVNFSLANFKYPGDFGDVRYWPNTLSQWWKQRVFNKAFWTFYEIEGESQRSIRRTGNIPLRTRFKHWLVWKNAVDATPRKFTQWLFKFQSWLFWRKNDVDQETLGRITVKREKENPRWLTRQLLLQPYPSRRPKPPTKFWLDGQMVNAISNPYFKRYVEDQQHIRAFKREHPFLAAIWQWSSDYGRSFVLWASWSVLFAFIFSLIYRFAFQDGFVFTPDSKELISWWGFMYYSVVTFTTLGFGDIVPIGHFWARFFVVLEVILGYIMLGGLISIFANKLARRS